MMLNFYFHEMSKLLCESMLKQNDKTRKKYRAKQKEGKQQKTWAA